MSEKTSKSVAKKAARLLQDENSSADVKSVAASVLTQVEKNGNSVSEAVKVLADALKKDNDFYYAYQANIAMAFKDKVYQYQRKHGKRSLSQKDYHVIANDAAKGFLDSLIYQTDNEEV